MLVFPPCKINIGLFVTHKRSDGYHAIESIFYPVQWNDMLEIIPSSTQESSFQLMGNQVTTNHADNIVWKALQLILKDFPQCHSDLYLFKNIPSGAGLGGGSADGAQALVMLNRMYQLQLSQTQLEAYAAQLGSDCPFFVESQPKLVEGRGEHMTPHALRLTGKHIAIIHPGLHVSTADAYRMIIPQAATYSLQELRIDTISEWSNFIRNDFESPVIQMFPEIGEIKQTLYDCGASYASMSGSGSAVYGLFDEKPELPFWPAHYKLFEGIL
jgi:4-diphosphocytidyl-2-C-methyl-D-erythritol kinase